MPRAVNIDNRVVLNAGLIEQMSLIRPNNPDDPWTLDLRFHSGRVMSLSDTQPALQKLRDDLAAGMT